MCPVVWNASSTILSSWSEAARWNTEKIFFQPERILPAWELTICAMHRTTISLIVGDLQEKIHTLQKCNWKTWTFVKDIIKSGKDGNNQTLPSEIV